MAAYKDLETFTMTAAADLSGLQYHIVRLSAAKNMNVASDATNSALIGVLQTVPQANEWGTVADGGISKVVAGGAITVGDILTCNGSGRAATVASGQVAFGRALEAATANGDVITARLMTPVRWSGAA